MRDPDNTHPHPPTPISLSPSNAPRTRSDVAVSVIGWIGYAALMTGIVALIGECVHWFKYDFWPDWSVTGLAFHYRYNFSPLALWGLSWQWAWLF